MANPNPSPATRFKPGQSGNPAGRPKGRTIGARLCELLEATEFPGVEIPEGKVLGDLIAETIIREALGGDFKAMSMLFDRTEGPVSKMSQVEIADHREDAGEELGPRMEAALEAFGYIKPDSDRWRDILPMAAE